MLNGVKTRILDGIPAGSRADRPTGALRRQNITHGLLEMIRRWKTVADKRGQTLSQMAISWLLKDPRVTSVLIGARTIEQLEENLGSTAAPAFTQEELLLLES